MTKSKKRINRTLAQIAVGVPMMAGLLFLVSAMLPLAQNAASQEEDSAAAETEVLVQVQARAITLESGYDLERTYTGELRAIRDAKLGFQVGGLVREVLVNEGDAVVAGDAIARLDTRRLLAVRDEMLASIESAQANLALLKAGPRVETIDAARARVTSAEERLQAAKNREERREGLFADKWIPFEELDDAAASARGLAADLQAATSTLADMVAGSRDEDVAAASAQLKGLQANLRRIDVDLVDSVVSAPFAGRISMRLVDEGEVVAAGTAAVHLVETNRLEARVGVPVTELAGFLAKAPGDLELAIGSTTASVLRAPDVIGSKSLPSVDASTRTATLILQIDAESGTYLPGEVTRLSGTTRISERGFWLPTRALSGDLRGLWSAFLLTPEDELGTYVIERTLLEVMHTSGERVFVRGDLHDGALVATGGLFRVVPGQRVRLAQ